MSTSWSPRLVANAFIYKARQEGAQLTHMKVQKLVFFSYAWSLVLLGRSVVVEKPQAWKHGPVFDSLYSDLKEFGHKVIDAYIPQLDPKTGERKGFMPSLEDTETWDILSQVWKRYGHLTAYQLSALSHEKGGPWEKARSRLDSTLDDAEVVSHYQALLQSG